MAEMAYHMSCFGAFDSKSLGYISMQYASFVKHLNSRMKFEAALAGKTLK